MELVAARKLRRAQARIEALRPFAERMEQLTMEAAARAKFTASRCSPAASRRTS